MIIFVKKLKYDVNQSLVPEIMINGWGLIIIKFNYVIG